ncbi:hypothetical protein TRVL_01844 [Trypanosoma vivax]|nr:hypothetical protein TRVL_01844 [Trypanosoma vivax]
MAKVPEPPHPPHGVHLPVLLWRVRLEATRRGDVEVDPPGQLQHRRVVRPFGAVNGAVKALCLRKPDVDWVFGREDAVRHFLVHWTFGLYSHVIFQRSPVCHLVDRLQPRLAQGILPVGSL